MREIKARGKALMSVEELNDMQFDHDNGWLVGNLIQNGNKPWIVGDIVESDPEYIVHDFWARVDPKTVGQYTRLKDKNGKEIYENDLTKDKAGRVYKVIYNEFCAFMLYPVDGDDFMAIYPGIELEVIGNIYEHPHLLRGDE